MEICYVCAIAPSTLPEQCAAAEGCANFVHLSCSAGLGICPAHLDRTPAHSRAEGDSASRPKPKRAKASPASKIKRAKKAPKFASAEDIGGDEHGAANDDAAAAAAAADEDAPTTEHAARKPARPQARHVDDAEAEGGADDEPAEARKIEPISADELERLAKNKGSMQSSIGVFMHDTATENNLGSVHCQSLGGAGRVLRAWGFVSSDIHGRNILLRRKGKKAGLLFDRIQYQFG